MRNEPVILGSQIESKFLSYVFWKEENPEELFQPRKGKALGTRLELFSAKTNDKFNIGSRDRTFVILVGAASEF